TNSAHSTGRQRRDGSRPSGNNNTMKNSRTTASANAASDSHPTIRAAGRDPGAVASPRTANCSQNMEAASASPTRHSSQPMTLPGTRAAISQPTHVYTPTATALAPYQAIQIAPVTDASSPSSSNAAASTSAVHPARNQAATPTQRDPVRTVINLIL